MADDSTSSEVDNHEVDRKKVTDPPPGTGDGDVNQEKDAVEDPPSSGTGNGDVDREKATVEVPPANGTGGGGVDREKATVEDPPPSGTGDSEAGDVDREKATVEDPPANGRGDGHVDRDKATVEDPPPSDPGDGEAGNVDQEKDTVEDPPANSRSDGHVDREKATVEDQPPSGTNNGVVDREKATVEDPPPSGTGNGDVNREKATVEDSPPSSRGDSVANCENVRAEQSGRYRTGGHVVKDIQTPGVNYAQGLSQRFDDQCNIVDKEKSTVEEPVFNDQNWTVRFHIQGTPNQVLVKGIPTESQLYAWNRPIIFGRGTDANIFLNDEKASRHHVELTGEILPDAQAYFTVRNLSSSKGFSVNNQQFTAHDKRITLDSGNTITVAQLSFRVELVPGHDFQNFKLEFVQDPPRNHINVGTELPINMVMAPRGPISPGFHGHVLVPGGPAVGPVAGIHQLPGLGLIQNPYVVPGSPVAMEMVSHYGGMVQPHNGTMIRSYGGVVSPSRSGMVAQHNGMVVPHYGTTMAPTYGGMISPHDGTAHWAGSGVMAAQEFGSTSFNPGHGGVPDRVSVHNIAQPPVPLEPLPHRPVQEVKSPEQKSGHKAVTKQPSENNEDSLSETSGRPLQDTQLPKDVD